MKDLSAKKRIMFAKGDDLYYFTYNILVILDTLNCLNCDKGLYYYEKLSYLIEFVSDKKLLDMLVQITEEKWSPSKSDIHLLQSAYATGLMRRHIITRLVFSLKKRGFLGLDTINDSNKNCVWEESNKLSTSLLKSSLFDYERENVVLLKKLIPRIRTVTLNTLLTKIFSNNGVSIWQD